MTILLFILILSILIVVHEAGHFLAARRAGVRVEQFALGFGPKLYSRSFDGTEYCLCLIPLGGFVKMAGDERAQIKGTPDEYFAKSLGWRSLIVVMGPVVNYVLAYLCFVVVFMIGYVDLEATRKALPAVVGKVMAGSPAQKAGLQDNDMILSVNNISVADWTGMQEAIANSPAEGVQIRYSRSGALQDTTMTPERHQAKDIFGRERTISRIGIQAAPVGGGDDLVIRRYALPGAIVEGGKELWSVTAKTYEALWQIITGQRSAKEGMTGLIGIFFVIKFAASVSFAFLLHIVGVISASLAIFNLLPMIPLDGGHLALIGLEKLRGRPLSLKMEDIIARIGFGLIIVLAVFVFYVDFERIGLIDKIFQLFQK